MPLFRTALAAVTVAATLARSPLVRAGLRAAPLLITPKMKQQVAEATLAGAYRAGLAARKLVGRH
jgi:hypothetical protein